MFSSDPTVIKKFLKRKNLKQKPQPKIQKPKFSLADLQASEISRVTSSGAPPSTLIHIPSIQDEEMDQQSDINSLNLSLKFDHQNEMQQAQAIYINPFVQMQAQVVDTVKRNESQSAIKI